MNGKKTFDEKFEDLAKSITKDDWLGYEQILKKIAPNFHLIPDFSLKFVVDTNILFSQVRGTMLREEKCLFEKLAEFPFVKFIGPEKLEDELPNKIIEKFPNGKQTKHLDIDACLEIANKLLDMVEIVNVDDLQIENYQKAVEVSKDEDDTDFIACFIEFETKGFITSDTKYAEKDFVEASSIKFNDAGKFIMQSKKGLLSFAILGSTSFVLIFLFLTLIKFLSPIIKGFINFHLSFVEGLFHIIWKNKEVIAIAILLFSLLTPNFTKRKDNFLEGLKQLLGSLINLYVDFFELLRKEIVRMHPLDSETTSDLNNFFSDVFDSFRNSVDELGIDITDLGRTDSAR